MRREVCDSKLLEELKEVSLLAELDLGCFMALVASITQLVTLSFLATARAELREKPSCQILRIVVLVPIMSLELLRQVSLSLLQVIRFFTARHARPGSRGIYLTDEGSAKFK